MKGLAVFVILGGLGAAAWSISKLRAGTDRRRPIAVLAAALVALVIGTALFALAGSDQSATRSRASSTSTSDGPGTARVCLTDGDIDPRGGIDLPATTVFEDSGPLEGNRDDPASWTSSASMQNTSIVTLEPIALTKSASCADVKIEMLIAAAADSTRQSALKNHLFTIADVLDYPIPAQKPAVEFGRLVDDIAVKAILLSDVDATMTVKAGETGANKAEDCLKIATGLAAHIGAGISRQTEEAVFFKGGGVSDASLTCPTDSKVSPDLFVPWEGQVQPPASTVAFLAKAGAYLTGATPDELREETAACISKSQEPDADEEADRQFRGVKLECQVYARNGGGGSVTVYRRFGRAPSRGNAKPEALAAMERASASARADDDRKAAAALKSAKEWQDPSIPPEVRAFVVITARKIALAERCPSVPLNTRSIQDNAAEAGIEPSDVQPGGRYAALFARVMTSMREGAAGESVGEACEAAARYR